MILKVINSKGLAHNSYFLADGQEAVIIDPRRDCEIYYQMAKQRCVTIKYILETHRNEDYVIGSLELQNLTGAEIGHSQKTDFKYGKHDLQDGDTLQVGNLKIQALYTPGHTNDSISYLVYETAESRHPLMIFTGDTLFAGNVGRTDLLGLDNQRKQTEKLYDSIHQKILTLDDHVLVYPAHGAGSVCGTGISDREFSTIGYERRTNPLLKLDKQAFIEQVMGEKLLRPPYFRKMEDYNLNGPPLLKDSPETEYLSAAEFEQKIQKNKTVMVDTRDPDAFAASHLPDSINIWLDGLSLYPGWTLEYDQNILLVTEREEDVEIAEAYLQRLGFDNIIGYLCVGIKGWRNQGKPTDSLGTLSVDSLKKKMDENEIVLVDVRDPVEWKEGHIEGAENIYVGHLREKAEQLPTNRPVATTCGWGGRGGLGASILKKMGLEEVYNVLGGVKAWKSKGYPLKMED